MFQKRFASVLGRIPKATIRHPPTKKSSLIIVDPATCSYAINRTSNGWLPVYSDYHNGRTRKTTTIRRVQGDIDQLAMDLIHILPQERISIKFNHIVLKGDYVEAVREWLTKTGF